jgi:hypothetical protein
MRATVKDAGLLDAKEIAFGTQVVVRIAAVLVDEQGDHAPIGIVGVVLTWDAGDNALQRTFDVRDKCLHGHTAYFDRFASVRVVAGEPAHNRRAAVIRKDGGNQVDGVIDAEIGD